MGLPVDLEIGTNCVQILQNTDHWNRWMDLAHLKFYGLD